MPPNGSIRRFSESNRTGAEHKKSWELKSLDPPTVGDVDAVVEEAAAFMLPPFIVPGLEARGALWAILQSGRLPAQGKRRGTSERIDIPMSQWTDLDWLADLAASADTVGDRMENVPKYDEVSVSGQRVREIWPPLEDVQSEEYHREDWTADHATLWIAYRDPALFHFVGLNGPRAQAQFSSAERRVSAPKKTLLNALQTGQLRAIRNGREIPPEYWLGRKPPGRRPEATRDYFRRSDVMRIFKDKPVVASSKNENEAKKLLARHFRDTPNLTRSDAENVLRDVGLMITGRPFDRVWRKARLQAGLPETASAGRPRKSSH